MTLLIHLGYLAYDEESETVSISIPNEEIRMEFAKLIRSVKSDDTIRRVRESDRLIYDTVHENVEAVAAQIEKIHGDQSAKGAIAQIKNRHYPVAIKTYGGDILLVGINYDKDAPPEKRKHTCVIERYWPETDENGEEK